MPLYRILRSSPLTEKTGEVTYEEGRAIKWHAVTTWSERGRIEARDEFAALTAAKQQFGGAPVVELVEEIHYV